MDSTSSSFNRPRQSRNYQKGPSQPQENHYYRGNMDDAATEEDTQQILSKAKQIRNESRNLTRDAVGRMHQTEQSAQKSLEMLNSQSEKLLKAQSDINLAKAQQKYADEQITELKRLHKFFSFRNPFRSKKAEKKLNEAKLRNDYQERMRDDADVISGLHQSKRNLESTGKKVLQGRNSDSRNNYESVSSHTSDLLDEDDRAAESEIDSNLSEILAVTGRLKAMAQGMSTEVEHQNQIITKLDKSADEVNVRVLNANQRMKKY